MAKDEMCCAAGISHCYSRSIINVGAVAVAVAFLWPTAALGPIDAVDAAAQQ